MSFTATVENNVIRLPAGVHLPDGTEVVVKPVEQSDPSASFFDSLHDLVGKAEGLPEDLAAEHDHYLHGTPKRSLS